MSEIKTIAVTSIDANPHRMLDTYPWVEKKVEALVRSIEDVGMWESIIVRKQGRRYQMAFGHHRLEAAQRAGLTRVPVIVKDLTDEQMLQYMGRENGEDYSTEFLIMLNTWEGAAEFARGRAQNLQALDIAMLLGWTRFDSRRNDVRMNEVAQACASAHALVAGGYLSRDDLEGLSVSVAKEIVQRAQSRMETIDKVARSKHSNATPQQVKAAKTSVAKGAKTTATQVRRGEIPAKQVRSQVDVNSYKAAGSAKVKNTPLFSVFGRSLTDSIEKMLAEDATATKLDQVANAVNNITMEEDMATLRSIDFQLVQLGHRTEAWRKRLTPTSKKVVALKKLTKGDK